MYLVSFLINETIFAVFWRKVFLHSHVPLMIVVFILPVNTVAMREMGKMPSFVRPLFKPNGFAACRAGITGIIICVICVRANTLGIKSKEHTPSSSFR